MIATNERPIVEFQKISHYIFENQITELFDSVSSVQKAINDDFEPIILDTIDLCIETLNQANDGDVKQLLKLLKETRKNIIGTKYDYVKKIFVED